MVRITPLRFGLRYNPPVVALEYSSDGVGAPALQVKSFDLEGLIKPGVSPAVLLETLQRQHADFLDPKLLNFTQVLKLVSMVIENHEPSAAAIPRGADGTISPGTHSDDGKSGSDGGDLPKPPSASSERPPPASEALDTLDALEVRYG